jgi:prevent-host-death family protein
MTRIAASEFRKDCATILNHVAYGHERIILQRHGKDAAVLVPLEDLALLEALEDRADLEDARAARAEAREQGTTSLSDLAHELGLSS